MDVVEAKPSVTEKPFAALLARTASLLALTVLGAISYGAPYITGLVYRQVYLRSFNVPETLFKSDAITYFTYAYMAVLDIRQDWMAFLSSPMVWSGMIAVIAVLVLEMFALHKLPETAMATAVSEKLSRNKYIALTTALLSFSAAITTLVLLIPVIIFPLVILPGIVGTYGAKHAVERDHATYDKGCALQTAVKDQCHAIMDGTRLIAAGSLITASDTRVAIYENHAAKIISLKDFTIESLSPAAYQELMSAGKISDK